MIAVLARTGDAVMVGQYALAVAVSVPILVLMQFRRREPRAADIRITSLVLALLGVAAAGFLDHNVQDRIALLLVVIGESLESVADLYAGRRRALSLALHGLLPIITLGIVVRGSGHFGTAVMAVLMVRLLVMFCYDFRGPRRERLPHDRERRVSRLTGIVPCYFVAHMMGYRALGNFAAIAALVPVAVGLVQAVGRGLIPRLARMYMNGDRKGFGRLSAQAGASGLMLGLCTVAGAAAIGPWVAAQLFGASYAEPRTLPVWLAAVAGGMFVATLLNCVLTAGRRDSERVPLEITAVAAASLACVVLVPRAGPAGAALAAGIGLGVQVTGQVIVLASILRHPRPALLELLREPAG